MTTHRDLTPEDAFADALDAMVLGSSTPLPPDSLERFAHALQAMPHPAGPEEPNAAPLDAATRQRIWRDLMRDQATPASPPQTPGTPSSALPLNPWVGPEPAAVPVSTRRASRVLRFVPSFHTGSSVVVMLTVLALIFASFSYLLDEDAPPPSETPGFGQSTPTQNPESEEFSFLQPISPDECTAATPEANGSAPTNATTHDYAPVAEPDDDVALAVAHAARNFFACTALDAPGVTDTLQTDKHQGGLTSNVPAYIANVDDIRALSESVMAPNPLSYFIPSPLAPSAAGSGPAQAMESQGLEDDRIWMVYLPEQASQLADGRVGIPMNYLTPPDIIPLSPELGFLLISYEIYTPTESGSWLLDETLWLCSGSCDALWDDPAAFLTASQAVTPPFAVYAPEPFADSNQRAATGRTSFTPDPAFDAETITAHAYLSDPARQTQSMLVSGNILVQLGQRGQGGIDDPFQTAMWATDLTTGHTMWSVDGAFVSGFATYHDTVFTLELDDSYDPPTYAVTARSLKTGRNLDWPGRFVYLVSGDNIGPIVIDDTLYVADSFGTVLALNAITADVRWQVEAWSGDTQAPSTDHPGAHGGALVSDGMYLYVATRTNTVRKLDATTGEIIWEQSLVEHLPEEFNGDTADIALYATSDRLVVRATSLGSGEPDAGDAVPLVPEVLMLLEPESGEVLQANPYADIAGNIAIADDRVVIPSQSETSGGVDISIWYLDRPHTMVFGNVIPANTVAITATGSNGSTLLLQNDTGDIYLARLQNNEMGMISALPVEPLRAGNARAIGPVLPPIVSGGVAYAATGNGTLLRIVPGTNNVVPDIAATPVAEIPGVIQGTCELRSSPISWLPDIVREYAIADTFSRASLLNRNSIAPFFENAAACRVQRPHFAEFSSFTISGYTTGTLDDSLTNAELRQNWIFPLTPSSMNASYLWEAPTNDGDPATVLTVIPNSAQTLTDGRVGVLVTITPHTLSTLPDATWSGTFDTPPTVNFVAMLAGGEGWYVDEFIPMCAGESCIPFYAEDPYATPEASPPVLAPTYPPAVEDEDTCTPTITMDLPTQPTGTPDPNDPCTMDCDPMEVHDGLPTPAGCVVLYDDPPTEVAIEPMPETPVGTPDPLAGLANAEDCTVTPRSADEIAQIRADFDAFSERLYLPIVAADPSLAADIVTQAGVVAACRANGEPGQFAATQTERYIYDQQTSRILAESLEYADAASAELARQLLDGDWSEYVIEAEQPTTDSGETVTSLVQPQHVYVLPDGRVGTGLTRIVPPGTANANGWDGPIGAAFQIYAQDAATGQWLLDQELILTPPGDSATVTADPMDLLASQEDCTMEGLTPDDIEALATPEAHRPRSYQWPVPVHSAGIGIDTSHAVRSWAACGYWGTPSQQMALVSPSAITGFTMTQDEVRQREELVASLVGNDPSRWIIVDDSLDDTPSPINDRFLILLPENVWLLPDGRAVGVLSRVLHPNLAADTDVPVVVVFLERSQETYTDWLVDEVWSCAGTCEGTTQGPAGDVAPTPTSATDCASTTILPVDTTPPATASDTCGEGDPNRGGDSVRIEPPPETPTSATTEPPGDG